MSSDVPQQEILDGVSRGIVILWHPKHREIDPTKYSDRERLRIDTSSRNRGSKWLYTVSREQQFQLIRQVLESHGARLHGPRRVYSGGPYEDPIGICNGAYVRSIEVEFLDGRYAHGYPCEP
jgi:hypothetical protein